jgi:CheY-like chemotaxis protein
MASRDRILVVDDNPDSVRPLIEYLEADNEAVYATSAARALATATSTSRPDSILLDVMASEKRYRSNAFSDDQHLSACG